jgi:hypothetical protein
MYQYDSLSMPSMTSISPPNSVALPNLNALLQDSEAAAPPRASVAMI